MNLTNKNQIFLLLLSITLSGISLVLLHSNRSYANETNNPYLKCSDIELNELSNIMFQQLSNSQDIFPSNISCRSINRINQMNPAKLLITTGRKRGANIVCISDNKENPCAFKVASFKEDVNPSSSLLKAFNIKPNKSEILSKIRFDETTSRVFILPQELLDNGTLKAKKKITKRDK